jgi:hypothetical protein
VEEFHDPEEAEVEFLTPEACAIRVIVSPMGYVALDAGVWISIPCVGRIHDRKPRPELAYHRAVCRCYLHPRCGFTISRIKVTNDLLLRWLFSGTVPPLGSDRDDKGRLRREHLDLWQAMKP